MLVLGLIFFIFVSIGLSKLDNKLGKTIYWKLYVGGLILSLLSFLITGFIMVIFGKYGLVMSGLVSGIFFGLMYIGMLGILVKASCVENKVLYIGIGIYTVAVIIDIYYTNYAMTHMKEIFALALGDLGNTSNQTIYLTQIHKFLPILEGLPIIYVLYHLALRLGESKGLAILWALILGPIYLPMLAFYPKVNNIKPCNGISSSENRQEEITKVEE